MKEQEKYKIIRNLNEDSIIDFLWSCDKDFIPSLSQRIEINTYSKKIYEYANVYCVMVKEQIKAMCAIYLNNEKEGFITSFNVVKASQKKGYGTILMQHVLHQAKKEKYTTVTLKVDCRNEKAIAFYKKNLFFIDEKIDNWIIMRINQK